MAMAVGYSAPHEVHESVRIWREMLATQYGGMDEVRKGKEMEVIKLLEEKEVKNYSWACP
jgi:hypothetical protein